MAVTRKIQEVKNYMVLIEKAKSNGRDILSLPLDDLNNEELKIRHSHNINEMLMFKHENERIAGVIDKRSIEERAQKALEKAERLEAATKVAVERALKIRAELEAQKPSNISELTVEKSAELPFNTTITEVA
jgi:CBS-domain-containing membrane protein